MNHLQLSRKPLLVLLFTLLATPHALADVILSLESVSAAPGSTGNQFDVLLTNTGPSSLNVAGFSFSLSAANLEIIFTGATTATAATYIFAGNSLFGPTIASIPNTQTVEASDLFDLPLSGATIAANSTVGLGRIAFTISNGATAGVFPVTFGAFPGTSLSDPNALDIPINGLMSGNITIAGNATVPEPSAFLMVASGVAAVVALGWKRIQRSR